MAPPMAFPFYLQGVCTLHTPTFLDRRRAPLGAVRLLALLAPHRSWSGRAWRSLLALPPPKA
jgi:hypothetical protein